MAYFFFGQCLLGALSVPLLTCSKDHASNEEQKSHAELDNSEDSFNEDNNDCDDCEAEKCSICLLRLPSTDSELCSLPCSHRFHNKCMVELRRSDLLQACPLCRAPLPSIARDLFDKAVKQYCVLEDRVSRGLTSWSNLKKEDHEQLAESVALWRESASRGVKESWFNLGLLCWYGRGTKQHLLSALSCFLKAAKLNQADAQNNLAFIFEHRQANDCDALTWYYKAAQQGHAGAAANFANLARRIGLNSSGRISNSLAWFIATASAEFGSRSGSEHLAFHHGIFDFIGRCLPGPTKLSDQILKVVTAT